MSEIGPYSHRNRFGRSTDISHAYDTRVLAGLPETGVLAWLEVVRETGLRQRFNFLALK